jgi:hypothetical protein
MVSKKGPGGGSSPWQVCVVTGKKTPGGAGTHTGRLWLPVVTRTGKKTPGGAGTHDAFKDTGGSRDTHETETRTSQYAYR